jgi:hypothetical protein
MVADLGNGLSRSAWLCLPLVDCCDPRPGRERQD